MPSPIGHSLAGLAAAWTADAVAGNRAWRTAARSAEASRSYTSLYARAGGHLTVVCVALGAAADLDLVWGRHRAYTHSVGAVMFVALIAAAVAVNARLPVLRVTLMCTAAYATHLLLDWLAVDNFGPYGIRALWPFSNRWYISGLDIFRPTQRSFLTRFDSLRTNVLAIAQELLILGPIVALAWRVRHENTKTRNQSCTKTK